MSDTHFDSVLGATVGPAPMLQATPEFVMGAVAGLLSALLYAISINVYKSQSENVGPVAVSIIKMWISLPFMIVLVLLLLPFRAAPEPIPVDAAVLLSLAIILGALVGDTTYLMAQNRIGVSHAFPIAGAHPIMTYLVAVLFLGEQFAPARASGVLIAVLGIVLISRGRSDQGQEGQEKHGLNAVGVGLALFTLVQYSLAAVLTSVGVTGVDPIEGNLLRIIVGSAVCIPLFIGARQRGMPIPSRRTTKLTVLAGFLGMSIGSVFYITSFKYVGAAVGSVVASTSPLFAVPISLVFLKEHVSRTGVVGIAITIVGVFLVLTGL